jgi:hypothetical protein
MTGMSKTPMFAPAAVACLSAGRPPQPAEIDEMAAKIWGEAYARLWKIEWHQVERGSRLYLSIYAAALMAFGMVAQFGPDMLSAAI